MKKLFLMSSMLLLTSGVFANDIAEDKQKRNLDLAVTACCTSTETSGQAGTPSYVSVTVTKCAGGATRSDAHAAACANASRAAIAAVKSLEDSQVTIYPIKH
jgi:hypothetical protein